MVKVSNEVDIYEINGLESKAPLSTLLVKSHWNRSALIVLEVAGQKLTVAATDLQAAILNATNTARHG